MADTAARLFHLLNLLQRRPAWSGPELADALGVDARTVRRDVERLRGLGYSVHSAPGVAGGYRLGVGEDLPPLQLDDDEALAVAVLLGVSARTALPGIERAALATLARIDRLLPPRLRGPVAALRTSTDALVDTPTEVVPTANLVLLAQACEGTERVTFDYRTHQGEASERRVEPHRLVATDRRWYLVAWDLARTDWRTFRVDRISGLRRTGHTFEPRHLDDAARLVADGIRISAWAWHAVIRVRATPADIAARVPVSQGSVIPDGPAAARLEIGADSLDWLALFLARLNADFEVLAPAELADHVVALGRRLVASRPGPATR